MRQTSNRRRALAIVLTVTVGFCLITLTSAGGQKDGSGLFLRGHDTFMTYCTSCHGREANGTGPMAANLRTPPADLTLIAKRNQDEFPAKRVFAAIADGQTVSGHASSDMPEWEGVLQRARRHGGQAKVRERIDALVHYLESIQV